MSRVNVAVALEDDAQGRIYEVAAACRALGLDHTATIAAVGVLTGSMESRELAKLLAIGREKVCSFSGFPISPKEHTGN